MKGPPFAKSNDCRTRAPYFGFARFCWLKCVLRHHRRYIVDCKAHSRYNAQVEQGLLNNDREKRDSYYGVYTIHTHTRVYSVTLPKRAYLQYVADYS